MLAFCKQNPASCKKNERTNVFHFRYIVYVIFVNTRIKRDLILTKMLVEDYVSSALRWTEACFCTVGLKGSGMPRLDYTMQKPLFFFHSGCIWVIDCFFSSCQSLFSSLALIWHLHVNSAEKSKCRNGDENKAKPQQVNHKWSQQEDR